MSIHMSSISLDNQGCRYSGGDKMSELSSPRRSQSVRGNKSSGLTRCPDVRRMSQTYNNGSRCIGHRA